MDYKLWVSHMMDKSAMKKNELPIHTTWIKLKNIMLSDIRCKRVDIEGLCLYELHTKVKNNLQWCKSDLWLLG